MCLVLPCLSLLWPPSAFIRHASSSTFKSALIYMFSHKKWTLHYKRIQNQGLGDALVTDVPTQQMWCPQYLFKLMIFAKTDSKGVTSSFHQSRNQTSKCRDASSFRSKKQQFYWDPINSRSFLIINQATNQDQTPEADIKLSDAVIKITHEWSHYEVFLMMPPHLQYGHHHTRQFKLH